MISGLYYIDNFLSNQEEKDLIEFIDNQEWNTSLKRRTQHYGYNYNYDSTKLTRTNKIPDTFKEIIQKFSQNLNSIPILKDYEFDQVIVNEYEPGQGISAHIDHTKNFAEIVVSLSLGSPCEMVFCETKNKENVIKQILQRKSLVILTEDARYKFTHAIPARKSDNGVKRSKRISLTFRKVNKQT
jgi:alkylated DNA repair dioxygenase AlkB